MSGQKVLFGTIVLLFFFCKNVKAQNLLIDSMLERAFRTDELLPAFIDSAVKFSPEVSRLRSITTTMKENLKSNKKKTGFDEQNKD